MSSKTVDSVATIYRYDAIDQLTSESRTGYSCSYTYDANGNRLTKVLNNVTESYTYDDADKMLTAGSKSYTYDAAGRTTAVTSGGQTTNLYYDYESRLTQIVYPNSSTNTFTYNGLDTQVGRSDSGGTKTFKRNGVGVTAPVLSDGVSAFTPGISTRASGATKLNHGDRLGTLGVETNASQTVSATKQYDAFGNLTSSSGSSTSPFGFAGAWGYQEDPDSGLKLLGHRYYDPSTGRFLTRDKIKDGSNWYVYCNNNPVNSTDAEGLSDKPVLLIIKGQVGGYYGTVALNWYLMYRAICRAYGDKYEIRVLVTPTKEQAIDAISDADAFIFYGHGSAGEACINGSKRGNKGSKKESFEDSLTAEDAALILAKRKKKGKGLMDFIIFFSCDTCSDQNFVNAWLKLIKEGGKLAGFDDWTVNPETGKIGKPKVWQPPKQLPHHSKE